ncbi:hypothetical protein ES704_02506 [subsurface metagenome]
MKLNLPLVSIVVSYQNEEKFISKCLDSIIDKTPITSVSCNR